MRGKNRWTIRGLYMGWLIGQLITGAMWMTPTDRPGARILQAMDWALVWLALGVALLDGFLWLYRWDPTKSRSDG